MTSAVIIILREVLEAMLLICTLMASARAVGLHIRWMPFAIVVGISGAFSYALFLSEISSSFDGFGQEIVNSALLITVTICLVVHNFVAIRINGIGRSTHLVRLSIAVMCTAIAMAMTREGAEMYLYVYAYGVLAGETLSVLSGAVIGAGIGLSLGTFVYYGLRSLSPRVCLFTCAGVVAVVGASMVSQATLYLSQADILQMQAPVWDTSNIVSESSLLGELLHASIGYEASPTLTQLMLYLVTVTAGIAAVIAALWLNSSKEAE
ncbi:MAG: FTR1 family protein [Pseudohongiellaceae bacterium]|nr:FTR1 family protein [Pseudohongiellaceae bacterium]